MIDTKVEGSVRLCHMANLTAEIGMKNRDKVVGAARRLFISNGFHQTGMAELATASGLGAGQIYRIFSNKGAIIKVIVEESLETRLISAESTLRQLHDSKLDPEGVIESFLVDWFHRQDDALLFDIMAEAQRNQDLATEFSNKMARFREILREMIDIVCPGLPDIRKSAAEDFLFYALFGMASRVISPSKISIVTSAEYLAKMVLGGLQALMETVTGS